MLVDRKLNEDFRLVESHVQRTAQACNASGSAVIIIHDDKVVSEQYWGRYSDTENSKPIRNDSQFHVASVRKSYLGFAVAHAIVKGYISGIDDYITDYLPELNKDVLGSTTIRHLLTHTHGLRPDKQEQIIRSSPAGQFWEYRGIGVDMLAKIVKKTTNQTISQILNSEVFLPLGLTQSGWYALPNDKLVDVIRDPNDRHWTTSDNVSGDKMNMYVSAQDLAYWGYIHLKHGMISGKQVVSREVLRMATSLQSPKEMDKDCPQNGFLWFVKDLPAQRTEIGELVPNGSYQILGYTGVTLLVIPDKNIAAVRMLNSFGSPPGYDYLADVRDFGDTIIKCL